MSDTKSLQELVRTIENLKSELKTWEAVGNHFGVHKIVVWRIVNDGYEPKDNDVRITLGLPEVIQVKQYRDAKGRFIRKFG